VRGWTDKAKIIQYFDNYSFQSIIEGNFFN